MRVSTLTSLMGALPTTFAIPTQPPIDNSTAIPMHFGILAFDGFQALDVFGPLDVLNTFAMIYNSTMHLSVISKTLDPVGTAVQKTSAMNMVHSAFGEEIVPTTTMKDIVGSGYHNASTAPSTGMQGMEKTLSDIDVLIVPGGGGAREPLAEEIAFVKAMYPRVKHLISVCTGSTILARAGVLDGKKATTNKRSWEWATSTGPEVNWQHTARWVRDGNIWTSSGVSAGIDVTYAWLGDVYGEKVSDFVAMSSEYRRWTNSTDDPFAAIWS
ncbi:DJ-1/PfpI family protein [Massarina eburnea CBS 473.64]|uniref:DJ-1/PfpI family protein n=1 Tax=Massarina eburnea CBS 473.64 TaxID=1395130 RepID=A0A6A6RVJ3_9PLEO|nr:DJ-1/PfpI family protein [Massarina eburnea CBS 473.64]